MHDSAQTKQSTADRNLNIIQFSVKWKAGTGNWQKIHNILSSEPKFIAFVPEFEISKKKKEAFNRITENEQ